MSNYCDHNHATNEETRLLPYGGDGNIIICYTHYKAEIQYRKDRNHNLTDNGGTRFPLPAWDSLKVYEGDK